MNHVLITGATGFTGSHVVDRWTRERWPNLAVFARPGSDTRAVRAKGIEVREGTFDDPASFERALQGIDVLVNVASLGFGHAPAIMAATSKAGVRRAVFVSTTALFTTLPARTKAVRLDAEERVRASGVAWTILRPTMIYGTPRDRNIWRLIQFIRRSPIVPMVGNGQRLQQPVHVDDVASAIWAVLDCEAAIGRAFNIGGARALSFSEMVDTVAGLLGRRVRKLPLPLGAMRATARVLRWVPGAPRLTDEQILRLDEDKAFPIDEAQSAFGYRPRTFQDGVRQEMSWVGRPR